MAKTKKELKHTSTLDINPGYWNSKLMIGTPMTGLLRCEWVMARYGQIIPTNWSAMDLHQFIETYAPMKYLVADAQNIIVDEALKQKVEWVLFIEHDNVIPPDCFIKLNEYIRKGDIPVVGGLYFTKSVPPEPMIYRGRGNSFYTDWKLGDKVECDGLPMGCTLISSKLLMAMAKEAPEYQVSAGKIVKRIFETPENVWFDPERGGFNTEVGTSDINWCHKVIDGDFLNKAGFKDVAKKKYPFLVDTNIFVQHVDMDGRLFPLEMPFEFRPGIELKKEFKK